MSSSATNNFNSEASYSLSAAAQEIIKTKTRFTDYLSPEVWPLCRDGFTTGMTPDSDAAKADLLQSVEEKVLGGCRTLELTPKTYKGEHKVILYIHGGALTLGAPDCQMQFPAPIAARTGYKVISIDYPLAPYAGSEDPNPAHTAALNVYKALLEEFKGSEIAFFGDSAGAGIAFGMALMARDQGLALPAIIVAYAPWVDLEQSVSSAYRDEARIAQTVVLTPASLQSARDAAFGKKESYSSYISPIKGNYEGFSSVAVAIYNAGRDLLREEGETLAKNLTGKAKYVLSESKEGMWHGYQGDYGMPEADECADSAAAQITQHLSSANLGYFGTKV